MKALRHPLARLAIQSAGVLVALLALQAALRPLMAPGGAAGVVSRVVGPVGAIAAAGAAYAALVRLLERRRVAELSLRGAPLELALGIALGAGLFSAVIGTLWLLGFYRVVGFGGWSAAVPALAASAVAGAVEEILFRGVVFRNLEDLIGTWLGLAASAALFGLLHIMNPNASLWAAAAIAIEAGILLAAGFVLTRRLWLVMGIHFAWNFTQGGLFAVPVSGGRASGLLTSTLSGPPLISGGEFGAEASVFAVAICLAAGVLLAWRAHALGRFVAPRWRRAADMAGHLSR